MGKHIGLKNSLEFYLGIGFSPRTFLRDLTLHLVRMMGQEALAINSNPLGDHSRFPGPHFFRGAKAWGTEIGHATLVHIRHILTGLLALGITIRLGLKHSCGPPLGPVFHIIPGVLHKLFVQWKEFVKPPKAKKF